MKKTWILDTGKYGLASGPVGYADPSATQEYENFAPNWEPGDVGQTEADLAARDSGRMVLGCYDNCFCSKCLNYIYAKC